MGADLNNIVKTQPLSDDHVQFLVYQILRGLKVSSYAIFDSRNKCIHIYCWFLILKYFVFHVVRSFSRYSTPGKFIQNHVSNNFHCYFLWRLHLIMDVTYFCSLSSSFDVSSFQDLKPSNIAVNEDCELKVWLFFLLGLCVG